MERRRMRGSVGRKAKAANGSNGHVDDEESVKLSLGSRRAAKGHRQRGIQPVSGKCRKWRLSIILAAAVPILVYCSYMYYVHLLEGRISRPLDAPSAVLVTADDDESISGRDAAYYWGSYRPGVYFGMKTRRHRSPVFGLMWFAQRLVNNQLPIRHWCEMSDFDRRYTWLRHDGQNFGIQDIHDGDFLLRTSFVKKAGGRHGGDWTARISLLTTGDGGSIAGPISLLFYTALDDEGRLDTRVTETGFLEAVAGLSEATGSFQLTFHENDTSKVLMRHYLSTVAPGLDVLKEVVLSNLAYHKSGRGNVRYIGLDGERLPQEGRERMTPNFIVHQVTVNLPFEMDVAYESASHVDRPEALLGEAYAEALEHHRLRFDSQFEEAFSLAGRSAAEVAFARATFSNLVGGIGYFSGHSLVQGLHDREPVPYFGTRLYTAVPSRSFFPRGFAWDEGFHNLLVGRFDADIAKDIVAHWLDTMNADGWIPREQILDRESRARVPAEFVVQRDSNANPPTLFLPLAHLLNRNRSEDVAFLGRIFPRLVAWFDWFNRTQIGRLPDTYRWRGRNSSAVDELNPITLTSGLDDYLRASHPTDDERHVDLRCWMAFAASVLARIARVVGEPHDAYEATSDRLSDNRLLDRLHWSDELQSYADYGLHTDKVKLIRQRGKSKSPDSPETASSWVRVYEEAPKLQFVAAHGYVSLFPFLLRILDADSPKLGVILNRLANVDLLWTDYGLRSLAKSSRLYRKNNRHDSPPYWRGAIWINMNYLAVEALAHYGRVDGPHREKARRLHAALRNNLVSNVRAEYERTGYVWEQYDDVTGRGQRAHPFTGWSALVTLIMSDSLDHDD